MNIAVWVLVLFQHGSAYVVAVYPDSTMCGMHKPTDIYREPNSRVFQCQQTTVTVSADRAIIH